MNANRSEYIKQKIQTIPQDVTLVAVTKTLPASCIEEAYRAGVRHFGENYVEEFAQKYANLPEEIKDNAVFHMIGHVQSRKVKQVVELFDWVDSVDSVRLARKLSEEAVRQGRSLSVLLEVNLVGEATKFGFDAQTLRESIDEIIALPNLVVNGLMAMPPLVADPEDNQEVFRSAKRLFEEVGFQGIAASPTAPRNDISTTWQHLSMGTSQDYVVAIDEGATMVRLGEAIFGQRPKKSDT